MQLPHIQILRWKRKSRKSQKDKNQLSHDNNRSHVVHTFRNEIHFVFFFLIQLIGPVESTSEDEFCIQIRPNTVHA